MFRPTGMTARLVIRGAIMTAVVAGMNLLSASQGVVYAAEKKGGMPQLDFANPLTTSQVVWLAIIFFVLYLLLSRWALPQVGAVLEQRASRIQGDLQAAHSAKASADAAVLELTTATQQAQASAQAEIAGAVAAANEAAAAQAATLTARLDKQLADAEGRINAARTAAMGALRSVATDTASAVVVRLVGAAPPANAIEQAVDAALAVRRG